ncbi:MAG: glycosyltransferase family 2 protein [Bacteroidales bacterium]|nr:glycosyltransferase family 2 protein [Bacteroidales bacterium]
MKLSAVIITHNEERNIVRCLDSLQSIADEVVVVDSGSTDKTEELCRKYDVRFEKHPWEGYSEQKNFADSLATNDWIFSIDADEALSDTLRNSIIALKHNEISDTDVFLVNRLTNYCGHWIHHCGWYPDRKIRLFNRNAKRWTGTIHETLADTATATAETLLAGDLLHYSYYSVEDHIRQADKFSTLTAKEAFRKGRKASAAAIWFKPKWKFFKDFVIKGGFLDGYAGYQVCKISAFATFMKYSKLRMLHQNEKIK